MNLPIVYFGVPFKNIEKNTVYDSWTAAKIGAEVLNVAQWRMMYWFHDNPNASATQLGNKWVEKMKEVMNEITFGKG